MWLNLVTRGGRFHKLNSVSSKKPARSFPGVKHAGMAGRQSPLRLRMMQMQIKLSSGSPALCVSVKPEPAYTTWMAPYQVGQLPGHNDMD